MVGIGRTTAYDWRADDEDFAKAWDEALEDALDKLELEARRRAHDGLIKKKFTPKGRPVIDPATGEQYYEREYSDTLLIFLLKGGRPEKYRERYEQKIEGEITANIIRMPAVSQSKEEWEQSQSQSNNE